MKTYSPEEYKKKYGEQGAWANTPTTTGRLSIAQVIANSFKSGVDQVKQGAMQSGNAKNPLQLFEGSLKMGAGVVNAAYSPLAPIVEPTIGKAIDIAGNKLSDIPAVQRFADSKAGEVTSRAFEDINNLNTIAGAVAGSKGLMKVGEKIPSVAGKVSESIKDVAGKVPSDIVKSVGKDLVGSMDNRVNYEVSRALDLTANDLNNIAQSTGHEVGRFVADRNLIGKNKGETVGNIQNHFDLNYKAVRSEIGNVTKTYKPNQVPRYVEALKTMKNKIDNTPGLQEQSVQIDKLLNKKTLTLNDVQTVKELIDKYSNIYSKTGDVGAGIEKQGLDIIRKDIRGFIEDQVKENTGADIRQMNNEVQTSREILDAVETRSPRGLTRSMVSAGDFGAFVAGTIATGGNPLFGAALLFMKKAYESPTIKLRLSKYLDSISDARKAKIQSTLESGRVPTELNKLIQEEPANKKTGTKPVKKN